MSSWAAGVDPEHDQLALRLLVETQGCAFDQQVDMPPGGCAGVAASDSGA